MPLATAHCGRHQRQWPVAQSVAAPAPSPRTNHRALRCRRRQSVPPLAAVTAASRSCVSATSFVALSALQETSPIVESKAPHEHKICRRSTLIAPSSVPHSGQFSSVVLCHGRLDLQCESRRAALVTDARALSTIVVAVGNLSTSDLALSTVRVSGESYLRVTAPSRKFRTRRLA